MTSIFLSYARSDDEAFVRRLHADLTSAGFDVWFDRVSMPSRQLTFHQEIRDAIAARERLLLVVGPGVLASDYVKQEWRFAYFEAGKCVNPIARLDGRSADGAIIDGYELIPEDLKLLHAEDFRDDAQYDAHLANLIRQLSEAIPQVGKLVAVPELPACFLAQPDRIKALRDLLLVDLQKPVVVSGAAARVGLQGMGGIGKSVLASALAHRPEVRRAFPDGIFWITLGQKPQLAEQQRWLARELGDEALFPDERSGKECLRNLLAGRKALLVLDDVWQREHAEAFNVIGAMGRILLTTRDAGLVTALASKETHYRVELPTEAEAGAIFAAAAQPKAGDPPIAIAAAEVREIVAQCGRLPLALALCGGMVQKRVPPQAVLEALRRHALESISDRNAAEEQHRNVWVAMKVSLEVLLPEEQKRFVELAVFPLDRGAPQAAVDTLWQHTGGLEPYESQILLAELAERSLVQLSPTAEGGGQPGARITLHDLLHNFATGMAEKQFGSLTALHQTLIDAYRKKCPSGWPSGPDDGYFFQCLCEHLLAAGKLDNAVELLTGIPWIEAKCRVKLVFSLQDDYRTTVAALPEAQEGLRQERERQARLARWTEEITAYSRQWSERRDRLARGEAVNVPEPQLPEPPATCRMWTEEEIGAECQRIIANPTRLDRIKAFAGFVEQECYPLVEFGMRPGFVVQHAFNSGPTGSVHHAAAAVVPEVDAPLLTRHWFDHDQYNPKPALLRTLEGHTDRVSSVSVTSDGQRAVSASYDKTLRVWDLESGGCLRTLEGHTDGVMSVNITHDGKRAVSGSWDKTVRVWDLETGTCRHVLEGHTDGIRSVSVTPDGRYAVSASDTTLRVWDLEMGACHRVLEGHSGGMTSVSITPDGTRAVTSGVDKAVSVVDNSVTGVFTLRMWDLKTGSCLWVSKFQLQAFMSATINERYAISDRAVGGLQVLDLETGALVRVLEGPGISSVIATPDGRRAASAGWDNTIRVWNLETGACLRLIDGQLNVACLIMTPDGSKAVSANEDSTLRLWNLDTGACLQLQNKSEREVLSLCLAPDSRRVTSANRDETLRFWDIESGVCLTVMEGHTYHVTSVSVTPDGRRAVSASDDTTLRHWELDVGRCLEVLRGHTEPVRSVSVLPGGERVVSASWDETLLVWNLATGACLHELVGQNRPVDKVIMTQDGRRAVSLSRSKHLPPLGEAKSSPEFKGHALCVWDMERGSYLHALGGHDDEFATVSLTPDGLRAISAGMDTTLRVWDLETGVCLRVLEGHTKNAWNVSTTYDGQRAVSASLDHTLRVWDLETGACLHVLEGHTNGIGSLSLTSDGRRAISASADKTLRVWDLDNGVCLAVARLSGPVCDVAVSPLLSRVVVGSFTDGVLQYNLRGMSLTTASQAS